MLHILNISIEKSRAGRSSRIVRSNSSNPVRNKIKAVNIRRDLSASAQRLVEKDCGSEKREQKQGNKVFAAMVPMIRKSIKPVGRFFSKHLNIGTLNRECDICYAQAQGRYFGIFLCCSCKEFFDHHSFKRERVIPLRFQSTFISFVMFVFVFCRCR